MNGTVKTVTNPVDANHYGERQRFVRVFADIFHRRPILQEEHVPAGDARIILARLVEDKCNVFRHKKRRGCKNAREHLDHVMADEPVGEFAALMTTENIAVLGTSLATTVWASGEVIR